MQILYEIKSPDHISKLLVESKWQLRLQDRLDEFSTNSTEKSTKMIGKQIQLQKYLMWNSKLYNPNCHLGHCGEFWGRASKGHLFRLESYLFSQKNHDINRNGSGKAMSNGFFFLFF